MNYRIPKEDLVCMLVGAGIAVLVILALCFA